LLIRNARQADAPVFFVQHANRGTLTAGSQAWQLHPAIQPLAGETVIHKRHGDAFEETDLQAALVARGVRTLVVTGLVTHGCVKATCVGALERAMASCWWRTGAAYCTINRIPVKSKVKA
jgi:nicotinamidase-related amidase